MKEAIPLKIERLSENQIRCTLNKADLSEKQLKISELAYGTPKARELFQDMMQQASVELGFEADDTPLMIEAIPVSPECLIMIVTKVEDPEELDTRFSRFSKIGEYDIDDDDDIYEDDEDSDEQDYEEDSADNEAGNNTVARVEISSNVSQGFREALEGLFSTLTGLAGSAQDFQAAEQGTSDSSKKASQTDDTTKENICSLFVFDSLASVISASKQVASFYFSDNCLYKNPSNGKFYLILTNSDNTQKEFVRVCSILSEYGNSQKLTYAMPAHFKEHFKSVMTEDAIQTLSAL